MMQSKAKFGRRSGMIAVISSLALIFGTGCSTVYCDWETDTGANDEAATASNRIDIPSNADEAVQGRLPTLHGEPVASE